MQKLSSSRLGIGRMTRAYISVPDLFTFDDSNIYRPKKTDPIILPQVINGRYISPWETNKKFSDVIKYLSTRKQMKLDLTGDIPYTNYLTKLPVDLSNIKSITKPHYTWIGHATCYYQTDGISFLTDPVWSQRTSPYQFLGPKRFIDTPCEVEDLKVDVVLLSHTHYDHLDRTTAQRIGNRALWIVPLGVKSILKEMGITNCAELNWWDSYHFTGKNGKLVKIIFTPAKHWTARSFFDRNTCLWGSFAVLGEESKFFFTGDTAYCPVFKAIGEEFGPFDLAAIPIGAYAPRWFMKNVHCNPAEAVQIHLDLKAKKSAAIHWGTFPMADEDFLEPAVELARAREELGVKAEDFFTVAHGETIETGEYSKHDFAQKYSELYEKYLKIYKPDASDTI